MFLDEADNVMHRFAFIILFAAIIPRCDTPDSRTHVSFWHFWSEPSQRSVLDSLVREFERVNPSIAVDLTELSWADGKAKLQLVFNSGTQPDVIHLGLDWFAEFDEGEVFANIPDSMATDGNSARWVVNVRALVHRIGAHRLVGGIATSDPHNVIKRVLPFLWQRGSPLYTRTPISRDLNDSLASVLWTFVEETQGVVLARSRQLDEMLLDGTIDGALTGPWIIDMAKNRAINSLRVEPIRSILNADVLAVSRGTKRYSDGLALIRFLTSYSNARAFCVAISDAGFPADLLRAKQDSVFLRDSLVLGFLKTSLISKPLPHSSRLLSIEPVVENMLDECFRAKSRAQITQSVEKASNAVRALE